MNPAIISLVVLAIMAYVFVTDKLPLALTAMLGALVLVVLGVVPQKEMFSAYAGNTTVILATMMVSYYRSCHRGQNRFARSYNARRLIFNWGDICTIADFEVVSHKKERGCLVLVAR